MTNTTLAAHPEQQAVRERAQALGYTRGLPHAYCAPRPPAKELDAFRGLIDGLVLALLFWLIVVLLIAGL
jgi:hypothetical protein